mgnify:CR=1 FL=1
MFWAKFNPGRDILTGEEFDSSDDSSDSSDEDDTKTTDTTGKPGTTGIQLGLDIAVLAAAHVNFEKLILKHHVSKSNHKLVMACCLVLAFKMYLDEPSGKHFHCVTLEEFLKKLCTYFRIDREDLVDQEFKVFKQLEFSLFGPAAIETIPHFNRLLMKCSKLWYDSVDQNMSPKVYFGDFWYNYMFQQVEEPMVQWMSVEQQQQQQQQLTQTLHAQDQTPTKVAPGKAAATTSQPTIAATDEVKVST